MTVEPDETSTIIQAALEALQRGDKDSARRLAERAASLSPGSSAPWLILAGLAGPAESLEYAEKALQVDPGSQAARQAFAWALRRQPQKPAEQKPGPSRDPVVPAFVPEPPPEPVVQAFEPQPESSDEQVPQVFEPEPLLEEPARSGNPVSSEGSPPIPAKPPLPGQGSQEIPARPVRFGLLTLLGGGIIALIAVLIILWPRLTGLVAGWLNPIPTPQCIQPVLNIGNTRWPIQSIARAADGSLPVPPLADRAYWVEGTTINYVFELNPTGAGTASLANIRPGDGISIAWADCTVDDYIISAINPQMPIDLSRIDQTQGGVSILVQPGSSPAGLLIEGMRPETLTPAAPEPSNPNVTQAEISFLDQATSPDGQTLTLTIAIKNTGANPITLVGSDISLTDVNTVPLAPLGVNPSLPQEIAPGSSQTLTLTFSRPAGSTAVFKILDFSVDIYY